MLATVKSKNVGRIQITHETVQHERGSRVQHERRSRMDGPRLGRPAKEFVYFTCIKKYSNANENDI